MPRNMQTNHSATRMIGWEHVCPRAERTPGVLCCLTLAGRLTWRQPAEPHGDDLTYSVFYSQEGTSRYSHDLTGGDLTGDYCTGASRQSLLAAPGVSAMTSELCRGDSPSRHASPPV
ncbi:hypothetical protein CCH79_00004857 [Gambusia affinis]|uniref:Fibronectin type-III domain-containing protein n=1 Tax=Gambusia affinis TaxID=33528 RepID=A0A315V6R1_GAMAF|nr:hypothetical protein CCH79_00004857 [Gambusia affinis]